MMENVQLHSPCSRFAMKWVPEGGNRMRGSVTKNWHRTILENLSPEVPNHNLP